MPLRGTRTVGMTLKIGYYTQEITSDPSAGVAYMDPNKKVLDYIRDTAEYVRTPEGSVSASVMLDRFLFPPVVQQQLIKSLSGGEKKRLYLLRVLMEEPNFFDFWMSRPMTLIFARWKFLKIILTVLKELW